MFDRIRVERALKRVALQYHMPVALVKRNIQGMLAEARLNPDPQVQAAWAELLQDGENPAVEELIGRIAERRGAGGTRRS